MTEQEMQAWLDKQPHVVLTEEQIERLARTLAPVLTDQSDAA